MSSQEGTPSAPWLLPAAETNDGPRQVSDSIGRHGVWWQPVLQLRAQRRLRSGFLLGRRP